MKILLSLLKSTMRCDKAKKNCKWKLKKVSESLVVLLHLVTISTKRQNTDLVSIHEYFLPVYNSKTTPTILWITPPYPNFNHTAQWDRPCRGVASARTVSVPAVPPPWLLDWHQLREEDRWPWWHSHLSKGCSSKGKTPAALARAPFRRSWGQLLLKPWHHSQIILLFLPSLTTQNVPQQKQ